MSDERLRELERAWRTSGASDDEASWITERIRAGELKSCRARCAAAFGHPASCIALGLPTTFGHDMSWPHALDFAQEKPMEALAVAVILREMARAADVGFRPDLIPLLREWVARPHSEELGILAQSQSLNATDAIGRGPHWPAMTVARMSNHLTAHLLGNPLQMAEIVSFCKGAEGVFAFLREPSFKQTIARELIPVLVGYPAPTDQTTSG